MTDPVNVQENIKRLGESKIGLEKEIEHLKEQIKFAKEELLRLEGCLIVFKGFDEAGIKNIVEASSTSTSTPKPTENKDEVHTHPPNDKSLEELYAKYRTM